jgi:hypothetical protein
VTGHLKCLLWGRSMQLLHLCNPELLLPLVLHRSVDQ